MNNLKIDDWLEKAKTGNRRAMARLLTQVERSQAEAEYIIRALYSQTGRAHVIGITGAPGSGKSTLVNELAKAFRQKKINGTPPKVGIVAVDPSSPFTGGALLGDRVRMRDLSGDKEIFIRSMASRGSLGGLAEATAGVVKVMDASGFDIILIETVGAGQAEVDIARAAPTTIVIEAPGMGDEIQNFKAGILEIADILVVNKADNPRAKNSVKGLKLMLSLNPFGTRYQPDAGVDPHEMWQDESLWRIPLQETIATTGQGVGALLDNIEKHWIYLKDSGEGLNREKERSQQEIEGLLFSRLQADLVEKVPALQRNQLITAVANRQLDPYTAVARLYEQIN